MLSKTIINKTSLEVSRICLGTAPFGGTISEVDAFKILDSFYAGGGNFLDTANVYGRWIAGDNISERIIGRWLKKSGAKGVITATKCAHFSVDNPLVPRVNDNAIREDLFNSLDTLGLDKVDFLWLHRDDPTIPVHEIIDIMENLVTEGYISYYGASNYSKKRLKEADVYCANKNLRGFSGVSNRWSPAQPKKDVAVKRDSTLVSFDSDDELNYFRESDIAFIPYNATASGLFAKMDITGGVVPEKFSEIYATDYNKNLYLSLKSQARKEDVSIQTILLRHITNYDINIIPITAVSSYEQLRDILKV